MSPGEPCGYAEDGEGRGEEGGEGGGDGGGGGVESSLVKRQQHVEDGGGGKAGNVGGVSCAIFRNRILNRGDSKHVVEWCNRGGVESAADATNSDVLGNLQNLSEGFGGSMGPGRKAIEEDREGDGMEDSAPVVEVDAVHRVAEQ